MTDTATPPPGFTPAPLPTELEEFRKARSAAMEAGGTTIQSKIATKPLGDVREQERRKRQQLQDLIADRRSAIGVIDRSLQVSQQPGWSEFLASLEHRRGLLLRELEGENRASKVKILQGRSRELAAMLSLTKHATQNKQALAIEIEGLQNELRQLDQLSKERKP